MALVIKKTAKAVTTQMLVDIKSGNVIESDFKQENVPLPAALQGKNSLMTMPDPDSQNPNCEVGFDAGYTHNLGNYQSAKVGVSLKIDCAHNEIDEVYDYAMEWVNDKMAKLREELEGSGS